MATFTDLSENVHVYNTGKAPQFFGPYIVPGRAYAAIPATVATDMQGAGVPIIKETDKHFQPLFKRCTGKGIVD